MPCRRTSGSNGPRPTSTNRASGTLLRTRADASTSPSWPLPGLKFATMPTTGASAAIPSSSRTPSIGLRDDDGLGIDALIAGLDGRHRERPGRRRDSGWSRNVLRDRDDVVVSVVGGHVPPVGRAVIALPDVVLGVDERGVRARRGSRSAAPIAASGECACTRSKRAVADEAAEAVRSSRARARRAGSAPAGRRPRARPRARPSMEGGRRPRSETGFGRDGAPRWRAAARRRPARAL